MVPTKIVPLTPPEEQFYDLMIDCEIMSMVREVKTQVWVETAQGLRRIDFVLIIDNGIDNRKGVYIEIDDPGHSKPERRIDDQCKEHAIFNSGFPLLRFTYEQIFNNTERVMNAIEGAIECMRGV